jgi:hypothetical protein
MYTICFNNQSLHFAYIIYLQVWYDSQNKQQFIFLNGITQLTFVWKPCVLFASGTEMLNTCVNSVEISTDNYQL